MDLKPENVFMDGPNKTVLKVGDFGNSVRVGGFDDEDGDPIYLAPEVLQGIAIPAVRLPLLLATVALSCSWTSRMCSASG